MKAVVPLLLVGLLVGPSVAADPEGRLQFRACGFSIAPLEATPGKVAFQPLMMFLPSSQGFSPNVNVQVQPYQGTMEEYAELSKKQLDEAEFTVISTKIAETSVVFEYAGFFQAQKLHWYSKAEMGAGKVYLVTATAMEAQWDESGAKLKSCVDSFRLDAK